MHFQPAVSDSGIPPFGIGFRTQAAADYGMSFQCPSFNHLPSLQSLDQSCHGGSEVQTLLILPPLDLSPMDDLTAIVTNCNNSNAFLKLTPSPILPAQPTPQFRSIKRRSVEDVKGKQEVHRAKRCGGPLMKAAGHREVHILSERRRRSGMNQLLSKMSSFLPNQTAAKSDKATIVEETIKYIHYLQRRLDIRIEEGASTDLSKQGAKTPGSSRLLQSNQPVSSSDVILPKISLNSHGKDLFITIKCGKKASLLSSIILVVEEQNFNVMDAFVSTDETVAFYCLHLQAPEALDDPSREALEHTLDMLMKSELQP